MMRTHRDAKMAEIRSQAALVKAATDERDAANKRLKDAARADAETARRAQADRNAAEAALELAQLGLASLEAELSAADRLDAEARRAHIAPHLEREIEEAQESVSRIAAALGDLDKALAAATGGAERVFRLRAESSVLQREHGLAGTVPAAPEFPIALVVRARELVHRLGELQAQADQLAGPNPWARPPDRELLERWRRQGRLPV